MKPASSNKRAKRAKAAAKSAKELQLKRKKKSSSGAKPLSAPKGSAAQTNKPEMEGAIAHAKPTMGRQEVQALMQIARSGALAAGPEVENFEAEFCRFLGLEQGHAVALTNGTTALYMALWVMGAAGHKVAMPAYGSAYMTAAATLANVQPCFIDCRTLHMNFDDATASGADYAVVAHTFGLPADVASLIKQAGNMRVIEDCSDALGAKVGEQSVGLTGEFGVFSFDAANIITTCGQGGMLVSKDRTHIDKVRAYSRSLDLIMTDVQAAVGRVQLEKLPNLLARREEIFAQYKAAEFDLFDVSDCTAANISPVRLRAVMRNEFAESIVEHLVTGMIEAVIPIAEGSLAGGANKDTYPNAHKLSQTTVSIPIYPHLSNAEVLEIVEQVDIALGR